MKSGVPVRKGVLLLCLGSPSGTSVPAVKRFLRAFLGDSRVIALPWLLRKILLECVILPFRAKRSAAHYKKIWLPEGSPFTVYTNRLRERLQKILGGNVPVRVAMRYGEMSVENALRDFVDLGVSEISVLPQFPHYAMSSYETAVVHFEKMRSRIASHLSAKILPPFYDAPDFISALADSVGTLPADSKLVISFHGIPVKSIGENPNCELAGTDFDSGKCTACDLSKNCYRRQCYATAFSLAEKLELPRERFFVAFQSRFGNARWLAPATSEVFQKLAGTQNVFVIAPGFTVDCLETLDELDVPGVTRIPCLNDSEKYAAFLAEAAGTQDL